MSIQRLASGMWRAQVYDPTSGKNVSVGRILGGLSTFKTRAEAEEARATARLELQAAPEAREAFWRSRERREVEIRARRWELARRKRERIAAKVERWLSESYTVDPDTGCWVWDGALTGNGYGHVRREGRAGGKQLAHRWFFERLVGPIPEGLCLDHLCRNPRCVNPEHLDPVTFAENVRRGAEVMSDSGHPNQ